MNGYQVAHNIKGFCEQASVEGPEFDGALEVWLVVGGDGANHTEKCASVRRDGRRIIIEAEGVG